MTKNETFKKRIRERMATTGERYSAARRHLLAAGSTTSDAWVSAPEVADERVLAATGRGWNEWRTVLDDWGAAAHDHPAIARHLQDEHELDGWWAQAVTGGYERITGRRLPNQMPDGTFTAIKNRTMDGAAPLLRTLLDDEDSRRDLFGGRETEAKSRRGVKAPRFAVGPGIARITVTDKTTDGGTPRMTIGIQHEGLPDPEAVEEWKFFWTDWLDAIETMVPIGGESD